MMCIPIAIGIVGVFFFIADYLEDPAVTEDQLQKMQKAEYEMRNSIIADLNEELVLSY